VTHVDRLLSDANPVPTPPPGDVTPAQERLLSLIVAVPRSRRRVGVVRLVATASVVAAVALVLALVIGRSAGVNDEVSVTAPGSVGSADPELIHVVTRLYGSVYGPGLGERLDGWLEPSTGRVRIVITTGDEMTLQQVADADDHVQTWQGALGNANGIGQDFISAEFAEQLRAEVRDRMRSLVQSAKDGFRQDNTTLGAPTTRSGEYRGRAVTIHRIAPRTRDGRPSGFYLKWYTDRDSGAIVAFERGMVGASGKDIVEQGEELAKLETFGAAEAPLHELDWRQPPVASGITPTPTGTPTPTPTPPGDAPTPTPTPSAR
jgi:hypothetical protein